MITSECFEYLSDKKRKRRTWTLKFKFNNVKYKTNTKQLEAVCKVNENIIKIYFSLQYLLI